MDAKRKSVNPLVSETFEVSMTEENRRQNKKEQNKQKEINDVIQLNEEAEKRLILER